MSNTESYIVNVFSSHIDILTSSSSSSSRWMMSDDITTDDIISDVIIGWYLSVGAGPGRETP